jgi:hypothetical protein
VVYINTWPWWGWGFGWGYPYAYGYPYLWPSIFNDYDNYDSQSAPGYTAQQPYDYDSVPYQQPYDPEPDQQEPTPAAPPASYPQQPSASRRAPYSAAKGSSPGSAAPLTLIFKDGRPNEEVYNYILTPKTLTVLDQNRHDIPVSEIDLDATAHVNLQAGVSFSLPASQ